MDLTYKQDVKDAINMKPIYLRNTPPPKEKFNHTEFFKHLFQWLRPECYLELGVRDGINYQELSKFCKMSIGVDIIPNRVPILSNMQYYQMTTDEYFNKIDKNSKFDVVFIDADHSHEQSLKDFLNVKDMVIEDGFIFLHDTYPINEAYMKTDLCNDVYKTALYIKQNLIDEFEVITLPIHPGVTMIKKIKRSKQLIYK